MGVIHLRANETVEFKDGEVLVKGAENVHNQEIVVTHHLDKEVNRSLVELLMFLEAVHSGGAKKITLLLPYYFYGRQDRETEKGCSVAGRWLAKALESAGVNKLVTIDIHSSRLLTYFKKDTEVINIGATPLFLPLLKSKVDVVVSPDKGGRPRAELFAEKLGVELAIMDKERRPEGLWLDLISGDVKDKRCVVVDDMLDTGGTMFGIVKMLKEKGAKEILIVITHGLFNGGAFEKLIELHKNKIVDQVYVTNSVIKGLNADFIKVLDVTQLLLDEI